MSATQIVNRQIADGAIDNVKVAAGAAIASSKLADGANFVKKDGSVAMTSPFDAGSQKIINLATPTSAADAVTKAYADAIYDAIPALFKSKGSVKAATTGNITIANPATAVFDGITLSTGDLLLVKSQTAPAENGIYTFNGSSSALTRVTYMNAWSEVPGAMVAVEQGTTLADQVFLCTSDQGGTIGTTAISWTSINATAGLTSSNFVTRETPSGTINGSNTTFTLANTPTSGTERVYLNGLLLDVGAGNDYTISGSTITMLTAPISGDKIRVNYQK
jgi:hypothetical protein